MTVGSVNGDVLDLVFGSDSRGMDLASRAASSNVQFVRSQVQLAPASEHARGRRLTATEALSTFGWQALVTAATEGSFPFITDPREPAATLKTRRAALGLNEAQVARAAGVDPTIVSEAETPGRRSAVRDLEQIAQALALDERVLGYVPNAKGDRHLGVRLRELTSDKAVNRFTASVVMGLSEAAWVVARQNSLSAALGEAPDALVSGEAQRDWNYAYPSWEQGLRLAGKTRALLGLGDRPIASVRRLMEDQLGIPLVQLSLDGRFAGATLANEGTRGVVINERGANGNVRVRRMTLCHELGHLLWDPEQCLDRLTVDDYEGIERDYKDAKPDRVEIRANAFAVAFLAPPDEVRRLTNQAAAADDAVRAVMESFGISFSAARHHIRNLTGVVTNHVRPWDAPFDPWTTAENLTIDFFPIRTTPISRRGRFANRVVQAHARGLVSSDTASMMLRCPTGQFERHLAALRDITMPVTPAGA